MKNKIKRLLGCCLILALCCGAMAGCWGNSDEGGEDVSEDDTVTIQNGRYTDEDLDDSWDADNATTITMQGTEFTVDGGGAAAQEGVLTVSSAGTYVFSGTLEDGQVVVEAGEADTVRIVLDGASFTCSDSAPIYGKKAGKIILTLAQGTENSLTDGKTYAYPDDATDEPDAALFSKNDLTINGSGALAVTGSFNNGIGCKDDLIIANGVFDITSANHGIRGRDSLTVVDGDFTINAGNDGLQSNNDSGEAGKGVIYLQNGVYNITSTNDGIQAETELYIVDGQYAMYTGGGHENAVHIESGPGGMGQRPSFNGEGGMGGPMPGGGIPGGEAPGAGDGAAPTAEASGVSAGEAPEAVMPAEDSAASDTGSTSDSFKALKAGSNILISGGTFDIDCEDDAIHSNGDIAIGGGTFTIATGDDGVHADGDLTITDCRMNITASYEGIEASTMTIKGGVFDIVAQDDALNVAGGTDTAGEGRFGADSFTSGSDRYLHFNGGYMVLESSGDGVDVNGDAVMSGGTLVVHGPTSGGDGALDYDGSFTITGGVLVAAGSNGMAMTPGDDSTQMVLSVTYTSVQQAGTIAHVEDSSGNSIVSFVPRKEYQNIVISAPALEQNATYTVFSGGSASGEEQGGLYADGSYTGGSKVVDVPLSDTVTRISDTGEAVTGGMGMGSGRPGGGMGRREA